MCRARPGPRCSDSGAKRVNAARTNLDKQNAKKQEFQANNPDKPVPDEINKKVKEAQLRLAAANQVYFATPAGQAELAAKIEQEKKKLPSDPSKIPAGKEAEVTKVRENIKEMEDSLEDGVLRRMNSYKDYHEFKNERPLTRQESINRGSDLNPRAQKNKSGIDFTDDNPKPLELEDFSEESLLRAKTWVEEGTTTDAFDNPRVKPAKEVNGVELGESQGDAKTFQSRMALPDGTIAEARHDHHITKNDEGKYVLSVRTTIATTFEDASPIDQIQHDVGHLLNNDRGKTVDTVIGEYSTLAGAKTRRGMVINESKNRGKAEEYDYARITAITARDITKHRFAHPTSSHGETQNVQKRGLNTLDSRRYSSVDSEQMTGYEKKREERLAKDVKKAYASARKAQMA